MRQIGIQTKLMPLKLREYVFNNPELTAVYYLPEEHYIGITSNKNLWRRMHQHRRDGHHTLDVEIVAFYKKRVNAHLVETMLHAHGYNGFRNLVRS